MKRTGFVLIVSVCSIMLIAIITLTMGMNGDIVKTSFGGSFNENETVSETAFGEAVFNESANETYNTSNSSSNTSASQYHTEIKLKRPPPEVVGEVDI